MADPYIVAIDPGKTSGMMVYLPASDKVAVHGDYTHANINRALENMLKSPLDCTIVVEQFVQTPGPNNPGPWSLEIIGACRLVCQMRGWDLVLQSPSEAHGSVSDAVLRELGWWYPGGKGDANMAARHMARYCMTRKIFSHDRLTRIMGIQEDEG